MTLVYVSRERLMSWPETRRQQWADWFQARSILLSQITEFTIDTNKSVVQVTILHFTEAAEQTTPAVTTTIEDLHPRIIDSTTLGNSELRTVLDWPAWE